MTVALVLFTLRSTGHAQGQRQDSLTTLKEEYQSLSRIFDTLNAGDTVYTPFFPAWSVQDRGVKLRIFSAFRNHDIPFSQDETICIIATPDQQDIADIRIGKTGFGRMYAKFVLSRDLHQAILARQYEYRIEVPPGYGTQ
jgi:hypothetical protein